MRTPPVRTRRWTRAEYERLVEKGFFRSDERLELLDGELIVREPQGSVHAATLMHLHAVLTRAFGGGYHVRPQLPIALDAASEPEPDLAVVPGSAKDYRDSHPSKPVLVVEIAETSLTLDRRRKARLYASAGIPEYWILNLRDRVLEVYRQPEPGRQGGKYRSVRLFKSSAVSPLRAPKARIRVVDLLL